MTAVDHLLAVVLVLVLPALSAREIPRLAQRVAADPLHARTKTYVENMAILWGLTLTLIGAWRWAGRPLRDVGLQLPETAGAWWWTLLITGVAIPLLVQQAYALLRSPDAQGVVRKQLESQPGVRTVLPSTPREARVFGAAAITAGICEEVLYRGFLLWHFQSLLPGIAAIVAAVVAFGAAHVYQGLRGVLATGAAGAIAMGAYLLTGSLLAPIVLHVTIDLVNGFTMYRALRAPVAAGDT